MTLLGALTGLSRRNLNDPQIPISDAALVDWLNSGSGWVGVDSGVTVNEKTSLQMAAVWRGVNLVSGVCAALPLKGYRKPDRDEVSYGILEDPHPEMTAYELWRLTFTHRFMWGNFYGLKVKNGGGQITQLWPLSPARMKVGRYKPTAGNPGGKVFSYLDDDDELQVLTSNEVFHLPGFGYDGVVGVSPIRMARQAVGLAVAAEKYGARLFGSGNLMSGVLQTEQRLTEEQAESLKTRWKARMQGLDKSHDTAVLDSGAKFQPMTMPNSDAQFLETRRFQAQEIERFLGVPPFLMHDTERSTSWGTGLEQQATGWVVFDLHPQWLAPTEARITKELLLSPKVYAEYSVEGLLRGDSAARGAFYRVMREVGAFSANDIRRLENRPPIPDGDTYLQPANLVPLGEDPAPDPAPSAPPAMPDPMNPDDTGVAP